MFSLRVITLVLVSDLLWRLAGDPREDNKKARWCRLPSKAKRELFDVSPSSLPTGLAARGRRPVRRVVL
jgi:hypothetical protein